MRETIFTTDKMDKKKIHDSNCTCTKTHGSVLQIPVTVEPGAQLLLLLLAKKKWGYTFNDYHIDDRALQQCNKIM